MKPHTLREILTVALHEGWLPPAFVIPEDGAVVIVVESDRLVWQAGNRSDFDSESVTELALRLVAARLEDAQPF